MSDIITIQLILAVSSYCGDGAGATVYSTSPVSECFKRIWACGHNTKDASVIVSKTHNCITKDLKGELKDE